MLLPIEDDERVKVVGGLCVEQSQEKGIEF